MTDYGIVKSLSQFISISEDIRTRSGLGSSTINLWWRGQANHEWKILPSLYRSKVDSNYEREICRDFRLKSIPFLEGPRPEEHIEWLFLMQHHGAPTRIVDWSESALIALFFAVENYDHDADAVVWVLNPWALNVAVHNIKSVPTTKSNYMKSYVVDYTLENIKRKPEADHPIAVRIEYGFNRAHSQRGMATIHGSKEISIEKLLNDTPKIVFEDYGIDHKISKIVIDRKCKKRIFRSLYDYSFGWEMLFPGLDGLAKSLSFRYSKDYFR